MPRRYDFHHFAVERLGPYGSIVNRPPAVVVVPESSDGRVWLARVERPPTRSVSWELPGGEVGSGESPLEAGLRELLEECDLAPWGKARALPIVLEAAPGMGRMPHHVIVASRVAPRSRRRKLQAEEGIVDLTKMTPAEVRRSVERGEIHVFATLSALAVSGWLGRRRRN